MNAQDTSLGGSRDVFPETLWSRVLGAGDASRADLELLARLYWRPTYRFIRTAGGATVEDAKDLTQEFFEVLIEDGILADYRAERGRFRVFLKGVLRHFLSHERRDRSRLKRGGGKRLISMEADFHAAEQTFGDQKGLSPEDQFDRQWATDSLEEAIRRMRSALEAEGKREYLKIFDAYYAPLPDARGTADYASLASRLGVSRQRIKSVLDYVRDRLDASLREVLSQGVRSYEDLASEMKDLLLG